MYYIGTMLFAAMAVVLVVAYVQRRRRSGQWPEDG